jgi:excisionase family DNA binding protein
MTGSELAEYLLVPHTMIYRLLRNGHLPFLKVGGVYRFDRDEIDRWIAHRKVKAAN